MGLDNEITPWVHHCGIIQSIFTALETRVDLTVLFQDPPDSQWYPLSFQQ